MVRAILGIIGGLVAWIAIATILDIGLRIAIPGYHAVERSFAFTLPMMIGRLAIAVVAALGAGAAICLIVPASRWAPWVAGAIMVALFLPEHIRIGALLPLWYHLFFLLTLAPLIGLGAALVRPRRT